MDATNIKVVAHKTGLVTQGVTPELDLACRVTHQKFLDAHHLTYWHLVILQVFGTPYVVIFSGASGGDESPNYKLGDVQSLPAQIEEILESHHGQWSKRTPTNPPRGSSA